MSSFSTNVYYVGTDESVVPESWATDKARIAVAGDPTGYVRYQVGLPGFESDTGNIYQNPLNPPNQITQGPFIPSGQTKDIYVGVGNHLWVTAVGNVVASVIELGTASSAQAGVIGGGSY